MKPDNKTWEDWIIDKLNDFEELVTANRKAEANGAKNKEMILLTSKENQAMNEIVDRIRQELATQKKQIIEKIENHRLPESDASDELWTDGYHRALDDVIKSLEE